MSIRFSGMMSGLDTDNMVQELMQAHQVKIDRVEQDKEYAEWQRDAFRDISNQVRGFKDTYFDFLNPSNNMRSPGTFNAFGVEYNGMDSSPYLSVDPGADAVQGNYQISDIELAKEAILTGDRVAAAMKGEALADNISIEDDNNQFVINLNGNNKMITIDSGNYNPEELAANLQEKINDAFGEGNISVNNVDGQIEISDASLSSTNSISLASLTGNTGLEAIGFTDGTNKSNRINMRANIADLSEQFLGGVNIADGEDINFSINEIDFAFDSSNTTLNDIVKAVNDSDAGVEMRYDELSDNFEFISNETGEIAQVNIAGDFLESTLQMNTTVARGGDASMKIDGQTVKRSSNNFNINGMTFNLTQASGGETINLAVDTNPEQAAEKIMGFVDEYNELIGEINGKLNEPHDREYRPLTQEQKDAMSDREIEMWEERAKSGILRRDPLLQNMLTQMRSSLFETVEGAGMSLHDLGINTSRNYMDGGRLVVDEEKLKTAIADNPEGVTALFTQQSDNYQEKGLSNRMYDIIQSNIRTTRDNNGRKGLLLEKAGIEGDTSEINNTINREIIGYDDRINKLLDTMTRQEEYYYGMFTRMESALSEMQAQSDWLTAQLGGMQ